MNINNIKTTALLALAGVGLLTTSAKALTYSDGDLLLGIYATSGAGATTPYVVDLGSAVNFTGALSGFNPSIGNIGADLTTIFGANWSSRSDLYWGVFGSNNVLDTTINGDPYATVYASRAELTVGTKITGYASGSANTLGIPAGQISDVGQAYASGNFTASTNSSVAAIENTLIANNFADQQTPDISFQFFNGALGNFGSGASGTELDLYRLQPGSVSTRTSTYDGSFTISNSGVVSFSTSPVTPVPEPSTVVIALALIGFIGWRERRRFASLFQAQS